MKDVQTSKHLYKHLNTQYLYTILFYKLNISKVILIQFERTKAVTDLKSF